MKKLFLYLGLFLFVPGSISAQEKYTYLKGQNSPFNGEFNEPRYIDVDSISYVYYANIAFVDPPLAKHLEDVGGFIEENGGYTLIKRSSDGLADTLKTFSETHPASQHNRYYIEKYSDDGKLVFSSSITEYSSFSDKDEKEYLYDSEGRILEIATRKNYEDGSEAMVYDTVKYDYELKPDAKMREYNLITNSGNTLNDSIFVFYNDSGYLTLQEFPAVETFPRQGDTIKYVFDSQGRLVRKVHSYEITINNGRSSALDLREPPTIEYKYTDNGYEEYEDGDKMMEYIFQSDGYCTEIIQYYSLDVGVAPSIPYVITKISYYKNGELIAGSESFDKAAPKTYGVQGGIVVSTEKSLPVSVYTFSGSLVKQEKVSAGTNTIPLAEGLYVVVIGRKSYKVLAR